MNIYDVKMYEKFIYTWQDKIPLCFFYENI